MEAELWDEHVFFPERLGPAHVFYTTRFSGCLASLLIDGHPTCAPWRSDELFNRLWPLVERQPCSWVYITDPDDACSDVEWELPCRRSPDQINFDGSHTFTEAMLEVFGSQPAAQGGLCRLVMAFHDRKGLLVFSFHPHDFFEIAFYGHSERLADVQQCI